MKSITLMASVLATLLPAVAAHAGLIGPTTDNARYSGNDPADNFGMAWETPL